MKKINLLLVLLLGFSLTFFSCLGVGTRLTLTESFETIPYDEAFEIALKSAKEMQEECSKTNPFNFPVIVSLGTSKSRGVITVHYRFDPEAGSVCTKPPESISSLAKRTFVPHFAAEFYMHIRFLKEGDIAKGVKIEITQSKGVKKKVFEEEMDNLRKAYLSYLKKYWKM
ncbi:hypothetical protein JGI3_01075 [Candidatus Kryptobacter tengchongensis]|uniref:hypothetical protein n=1 Tax=Kryptobacter tengchongensis TaxID=1643429 RepID=UPI0007081664|nr:hypothetical protein [Candidatus Kryptobacter tengchongensis]CUS79087.1 hypothetical protein JGI20_00575 [Candidatus Kryptobacter tengchongensis]CUU05153.1 hypothetical protein JGI3_01075 [Candidatus Kryptobacter tengchongensis]